MVLKAQKNRAPISAAAVLFILLLIFALGGLSKALNDRFQQDRQVEEDLIRLRHNCKDVGDSVDPTGEDFRRHIFQCPNGRMYIR